MSMNRMIEDHLLELMAKLDRQMERKGEVNRATFEEFTLYHKLYNELSGPSRPRRYESDSSD
jgi:hypothetical protein